MLATSPMQAEPKEASKRRDEAALVRARYDRVAPIYDTLEFMMEVAWRPWRRELWSRVSSGDRVLEVGVGTGKNIPYYPEGITATGIDIAPRMLSRARARAARFQKTVQLEVADVQDLSYADASFDVAVSTCVFCSVPDPVLGLRELRRVVRPGGRILMLEHVLSKRPALAWLMSRLDPVIVRLWGAHINLDTLANLELAGLAQAHVDDVMLDVMKLIDVTLP